ncbi:MAG: PepSY-associated TM helix domain-containing protein [Prevotella sp.]|jgi:hypothetical protein|nr:PepSY-associated TM helix domain-containing protein [Prevotella sp.]
MKLSLNKVKRYLRVVHRDLGFLMVGISLVYALSGILLNHMNGNDPAFKTVEKSIQIEKGLTQEELKILWNDKTELPPTHKITRVDEEHYRLMLQGGIGVYNSTNGYVDYETHTKREFIYWINKLHYNKVKGWFVMGDLFAVSLIFLAISGLFIVAGKNGIGGRGKWYLFVGILIPIIYIIIG